MRTEKQPTLSPAARQAGVSDDESLKARVLDALAGCSATNAYGESFTVPESLRSHLGFDSWQADAYLDRIAAAVVEALEDPQPPGREPRGG